jgi:hypothetical protein
VVLVALVVLAAEAKVEMRALVLERQELLELLILAEVEVARLVPVVYAQEETAALEL